MTSQNSAPLLPPSSSSFSTTEAEKRLKKIPEEIRAISVQMRSASERHMQLLNVPKSERTEAITFEIESYGANSLSLSARENEMLFWMNLIETNETKVLPGWLLALLSVFPSLGSESTIATEVIPAVDGSPLEAALEDHSNGIINDWQGISTTFLPQPITTSSFSSTLQENILEEFAHFAPFLELESSQSTPKSNEGGFGLRKMK
ncbi:hypothetical protein BCR33DRAFT_827488 [Rhizoclosmatium globosum]|uniref:Uncharacterized protein n=1 Tax=Rhizoclosmatium globosum TaxID=329046 RepID=A0A1Y2C120_9FUNG|nr:hypothetical protein BCR33DRAFT_827488 [Rhizoclosmatium globosum]|eukprot:ORY40666.1 hypothetical protein BCR33DRAFT_827488 [Rhizoclosmatium globosum]